MVQNNLNNLKEKKGFSVPDGYFEHLTSKIMDQLPMQEIEKKQMQKNKQVSLMDRVRPWIYMAAVFAGLGLFFKVLVGPVDSSSSSIHERSVDTSIAQMNEDDIYWEYLEKIYVDDMLMEKMEESE